MMALVVLTLSVTAARAATIEWVTVGDPGNAADQDYGDGQFGAVSVTYRIGKYEVTNTEYAEFLNAVADEDPNGLYNTMMGGTAVQRGGITRSGTSPNYSYSVKTNMGNKPVNYVSWYDSLRFANWLHNSQPAGAQDASTTEDGAYTMIAETYPGGPLITRNAGAKVWLPSEGEWYKAAYYDPRATSAGGPPGDDNYWLYATRSDSTPTVATANATGDINNPGANVVNYDRGADWNGQDGNFTTVGSAGASSDGYYGTADMNGNTHEWNETLISGRGYRGGSWNNVYLQASFRNSSAPANQFADLGFRVASIPEPSTAVLGMLGVLCCLLWRRPVAS